MPTPSGRISVHGIEEFDVCADLVQAQRGGQAADAGPDDDAAQPRHSTSWTSMVTRPWSRRPVETASRSFNQDSRSAAVVKRMWVRK